MAKSETGIWIDDASGDIVTSPPHRGTQLVAPGSEISGQARTRAEAHGLSIPVVEQAVEPGVETADAPEVETTTEGNVETADVKPKRGRAAKG